MMLSNFKFSLFCCINVMYHVEKSVGNEFSRRVQKRNELKPSTMSEWRFNDGESFNPQLTSIIRNGHVQKLPNLEVTFEPPKFGAPDHWKHETQRTDGSNRKFFFEEDSSHRITGISQFYRLMGNIFREGIFSAKKPIEHVHYSHRDTRTGHKLLFNPLGYRSPETNFIKNKPIRASVIKLETITRSPYTYTPKNYGGVQNHYSSAGTILNQVLIENAKSQYIHDLESFPKKPNFPVLPKKEESGYQTYFSRFQYNESHMRENQAHKQRQPQKESVLQMTVNTIPYVTPSLPFVDPLVPYSKENIFRSNYSITDGLIYDLKATHDHSDSNEHGRSRNKWQLTTLETTEPKMKRKPHLLKKKPSAMMDHFDSSDKESIEIIANLTAEGVSNKQKHNYKIQKFNNYVDVKNLINYEKEKLENVTNYKNSSFSVCAHPKSLSENVNLNDELSLDARILKDTNWDGLITTKKVTKTTATKALGKDEKPFSTTVGPSKEEKEESEHWEHEKIVIEPHKANHIKEEHNDTFKIIDSATSNTNSTTTVVTKTSPAYVSSTTQTTSVFSKEQNTTKDGFDRFMPSKGITTTETTPTIKFAINNAYDDAVLPIKINSSLADGIIKGHKYRLRQKASGFSPANNQLKEWPSSKPSITEKNEERNVTFVKEGEHIAELQKNRTTEVMTFSDEEIKKKRRKLTRRRKVYKKIRKVTTEKSVLN